MARSMVLGLLLAGSLGFARQSGVAVLNSTFESGLEGWTTTAPTGSPPCGWFADATPVPSAAPGSPPNSLNFNDGTDFATSPATTVTGSATSPVMNLAGATSATLTFVCRYQTETTSSTSSFDQRRVQMSTDNFAGTPPFNTQLGSTGTSPCPAMLTWHAHSFDVPVALLASNFRVRFFFNSFDSIANTGQGWFVDNVVVSATGISPPGGAGGSGFGQGGASRDNSNGDQGINDLFCGGGAAASAGPPAVLVAIVLVALAGGARRARWLVLAALFVLAGGGAASLQSTSTPLSANFDSGLGTWTTTAATGSPPCGWFADSTPTPSASPGSPPNSLNFNNGTDFNTGATVTGSATSPAVSLAGATSATLTFVCMYQTEDTGTFYDQRWVQMSTDNFVAAPPAFNQQLSTTGAGSSPCAAMLSWHTHSFAVPASLLAANFRVRFFFNSVDSAFNTYQGWFVDNVVVTASGIAPPPPPPPPPGPGGTAGPADIPDAESRTDPLCGGGASHSAGAAPLVLAIAALALAQR